MQFCKIWTASVIAKQDMENTYIGLFCHLNEKSDVFDLQVKGKGVVKISSEYIGATSLPQEAEKKPRSLTKN